MKPNHLIDSDELVVCGSITTKKLAGAFTMRIDFQMERDANGVLTGVLSWTRGAIITADTRENGGYNPIAAGSVHTLDTRTTIFWEKDSPKLTAWVGHTQPPADAVVLAIFTPTSGLTVLSGGTVIDGSRIVAASITAKSIPAGSLAITRLAGFDIGEAVAAMKRGQRVRRAGWNGKGMFLFLVAGSTFKVNRPPLLGIYPEGTEIRYHAHVDMKTATGEVVPWLCSQSDLLAEDWEIVADAQIAEPAPELPLSPVDAAERAWELAK